MGNASCQLSDADKGQHDVEKKVAAPEASPVPELKKSPSALLQEENKLEQARMESKKAEALSAPGQPRICPRLSVFVSHASHLDSMDRNGSSDPYCVVELLEAGKEIKAGGDEDALLAGSTVLLTYKTDVVYKSLNPNWRFDLEYALLPSADLQSMLLRFTIFDWNNFLSDDLIGTAVISLADLISAYPAADGSVGAVNETLTLKVKGSKTGGTVTVQIVCATQSAVQHEIEAANIRMLESFSTSPVSDWFDTLEFPYPLSTDFLIGNSDVEPAFSASRFSQRGPVQDERAELVPCGLSRGRFPCSDYSRAGVSCLAVLADWNIGIGYSREPTTAVLLCLIDVYDRRTARVSRSFYGHSQAVTALCSLSDGTLVSGGLLGGILLWNMERSLKGREVDTGPIVSAAAVPGQDLFVTVEGELSMRTKGPAYTDAPVAASVVVRKLDGVQLRRFALADSPVAMCLVPAPVLERELKVGDEKQSVRVILAAGTALQVVDLATGPVRSYPMPPVELDESASAIVGLCCDGKRVLVTYNKAVETQRTACSFFWHLRPNGSLQPQRAEMKISVSEQKNLDDVIGGWANLIVLGDGRWVGTAPDSQVAVITADGKRLHVFRHERQGVLGDDDQRTPKKLLNLPVSLDFFKRKQVYLLTIRHALLRTTTLNMDLVGIVEQYLAGELHTHFRRKHFAPQKRGEQHVPSRRKW